MEVAWKSHGNACVKHGERLLIHCKIDENSLWIPWFPIIDFPRNLQYSFSCYLRVHRFSMKSPCLVRIPFSFNLPSYVENKLFNELHVESTRLSTDFARAGYQVVKCKNRSEITSVLHEYVGKTKSRRICFLQETPSITWPDKTLFFAHGFEYCEKTHVDQGEPVAYRTSTDILQVTVAATESVSEASVY